MRISLLVIAIPAMTFWAACTSLARALDERLPKRVAEITRTQIRSYLGTNDLAGIPLLDRKVDWDTFSNWPDEFNYRGRTYRVQLTDTSGGDYMVKLNSRTELKPGRSFLARYMAGTNFPPQLGISAAWHPNGVLSERIVDVEGKRVYGHQFVPSGKLYLFLRGDVELKAYVREHFDPSGRRIGSVTSLSSSQKCEWDGIEIDPETFLNKEIELYHSFGK